MSISLFNFLITSICTCMVSQQRDGKGIIYKILRKGRCSKRDDRSCATVIDLPSQRMDPFEDNYYRLNRKMMSLLGLWSTKAKRERLFRYYVIGAMLFYFTLIQFCQLLTVDLDLQSMLFILQIFIPTICIASVYSTYIIQFVSVQKIFNCIREDCQRLKDDTELRIMQKYAYQCKLYTLTCGFMFILFVGFFILPPVLRKIVSFNKGRSTTDRFPIFSCHDYFLDSESYYYSILIYQIIVVAVEVTVLLSCYSGYFIVIQHICALLSIIKSKIQQHFINNHCDDKVLVTPLDHSDWIIDIAQRLTRSREITNLMNTVFENCYLFQMSLACILIVIGILCLFQIPVLLKHAESKKDIVTFLVFIIGSVLPTYVNCYMGQRLIDYGMDVYNEACLIPIHNISLKTQKLLLTMIILNDKPYTMTIGKFFVSSHEFFQSLLRVALSFAMMLHSAQSI